MTWADHADLLVGADASTKDWLIARKSGVGASDTSGIMQVNDRSSPLKVWAEKLGKIPEFLGNADTERGNFWEPWLAAWFAKEHQVSLYQVGLLRSKEWPWMLATPDRLVKGFPELVEIKTSKDFPALRSPWADGQISDHAETQVQHQLAVTGYKVGWVVVMIGCDPPFVRQVRRDDTHIEQIVEQTRQFWDDFVNTGREPQALPQDSDVVDQLHRANLPSPVELPVEAYGWIMEHRHAKAAEKAAKKKKDQAANVLRQMLGDADHGIMDDRELVRVSTQTTQRLDTARLKEEAPDIYLQYRKTTTSRVLRVRDDA